MFLMLPTKAGEAAYQELESKFLTTNFEELFQKMEPVYAEIELPRMKMEFQTNLKGVLKDIGRHCIFLNQFIKVHDTK